jgi:hypothetical protein
MAGYKSSGDGTQLPDNLPSLNSRNSPAMHSEGTPLLNKVLGKHGIPSLGAYAGGPRLHGELSQILEFLVATSDTGGSSRRPPL